jgi:hypothetical protein
MKLDKKTIGILENFSGINQSIAQYSGDVIKTISVQKNILAKATVGDSFPQDFCVYDLKEFLSGISLFQNPDIDFDTQYMTITDSSVGGGKTLYYYADESIIVKPEKDITMPPAEVSVTLSAANYDKLLRAAAVYMLPDFCIRSDGESVVAEVLDKNSPTSNTYSRELSVDGSNGATFKFFFKVENMKILKGDYDLEISSKFISHFTHKTEALEYWIALEPDSAFEQ